MFFWYLIQSGTILTFQPLPSNVTLNFSPRNDTWWCQGGHPVCKPGVSMPMPIISLRPIGWWIRGLDGSSVCQLAHLLLDAPRSGLSNQLDPTLPLQTHFQTRPCPLPTHPSPASLYMPKTVDRQGKWNLWKLLTLIMATVGWGGGEASQFQNDVILKRSWCWKRTHQSYIALQWLLCLAGAALTIQGHTPLWTVIGAIEECTGGKGGRIFKMCFQSKQWNSPPKAMHSFYYSGVCGCSLVECIQITPRKAGRLSTLVSYERGRDQAKV